MLINFIIYMYFLFVLVKKNTKPFSLQVSFINTTYHQVFINESDRRGFVEKLGEKSFIKKYYFFFSY